MVTTIPDDVDRERSSTTDNQGDDRRGEEDSDEDVCTLGRSVA